MIKRLRFLALAIFVLPAALGGGLVSCGIETYKYLQYVDPGIPMTLNTTAYISLPGGQPYYFRYFIIYYRIYISDFSTTGSVDAGMLAQINPALYTDYNYFYSYTNTQSAVAPTSMGDTFANRKYFPLELDKASGTSIESILSDTGGGVITLEFAANPQFKPSLVMGNLQNETPGLPFERYQLSRNTRNNNPYAGNNYFVNSDDVNNGDHISSDSTNTNQDVQNSPQTITGTKYTYVSMYILAHGMDDSNFTNIFSIPTFIGVFRLPD
ncbi:MAG: hypothetical protein LBT87_01975 [Treponema sp.]|jgi:hypothetical protein|nr:hypothetical protein [Treponema sp.]